MSSLRHLLFIMLIYSYEIYRRFKHWVGTHLSTPFSHASNIIIHTSNAELSSISSLELLVILAMLPMNLKICPRMYNYIVPSNVVREYTHCSLIYNIYLYQQCYI